MTDALKRCARCEQEKPATRDFFSKRSDSADHLYYICKECDYAAKRKPPKYIVPEGYKRCPQCGENKPATTEYFYPREKSKDGLYSWCRPCDRKKKKDRKPRFDPDMTRLICIKCGEDYPATPEYFHRHRDGVNGIRPICKECGRKSSIEWRNNHIDQARASAHQWRMIHKEYVKAYSKQDYHARKDCYRERRQRWYTANAEHMRQYRKATSEQRHAYNLKRKSMLRGASGTFTPQDIQKQLRNQHGRCYYCHQKVTKYHVDHVIPVIHGGSNDPSNLVISCPTCNLRKGSKLPHEWFEGGRLL